MGSARRSHANLLAAAGCLALCALVAPALRQQQKPAAATPFPLHVSVAEPVGTNSPGLDKPLLLVVFATSDRSASSWELVIDIHGQYQRQEMDSTRPPDFLYAGGVTAPRTPDGRLERTQVEAIMHQLVASRFADLARGYGASGADGISLGTSYPPAWHQTWVIGPETQLSNPEVRRFLNVYRQVTEFIPPPPSNSSLEDLLDGGLHR